MPLNMSQGDAPLSGHRKGFHAREKPSPRAPAPGADMCSKDTLDRSLTSEDGVGKVQVHLWTGDVGPLGGAPAGNTALA